METEFRYTQILSLIIIILNFCISNSVNAQVNDEQERIYVKLEIKGMACPYCAFGMEKELRKVAGADNIEIELKKGLAYISTSISQKPTKESLEKIITDAGFTVGIIEFKKKPFVRTKEK